MILGAALTGRLRNGRLAAHHASLFATFIVLGGLYAIAAARHPSMLDPWTLRNLAIGGAVLGLVSLGMTLVIISGGIDLSVGAAIGFASILVATRVEAGWHPVAAWGAALALGAGAGAAMGALIHAFRLPPFLVTLGGMFCYRGVALLISERSIGIRESWYGRLGEWQAGPLPPVAGILAAAFLLVWLYAARTRLGRTACAVGSAEPSARLMGLPVARAKVAVYAISGLCAATAGIAMTIASGAGNATAGALYELDAIAATVIGGTPLSGGVGSVPGTLAGVAILGLIQELITLEGVSNSWWARIATGGLLLAFILLQRGVQARLGTRS